MSKGIDKKTELVIVRFAGYNHIKLLEIKDFYSSLGVPVTLSAVLHKLVIDEYNRLIADGSLKN